MQVRTVVAGFAVALGLALTAGSVTAFAQADGPDKTKGADNKRVTLSTLRGVQAAPMAEKEMDKVKGLHIHFTTPSQNAGHPLVDPETGWHFVNFKENNLGKGQALPISGPGYSGLCGAALLSPTLTIPGQNPATGVGGGC